MSKLKVHRFITTDELFPEANAGALYYDKSEADKEIAELKKARHDRDDWCLHTLKENRHLKYKRCLLMAKICQLRCDRYERYLASLAYHGLPTIQRCRVLKNHYDKWYSRWLAIAEEFKEAP